MGDVDEIQAYLATLQKKSKKITSKDSFESSFELEETKSLRSQRLHSKETREIAFISTKTSPVESTLAKPSVTSVLQSYMNFEQKYRQKKLSLDSRKNSSESLLSDKSGPTPGRKLSRGSISASTLPSNKPHKAVKKHLDFQYGFSDEEIDKFLGEVTTSESSSKSFSKSVVDSAVKASGMSLVAEYGPVDSDSLTQSVKANKLQTSSLPATRSKQKLEIRIPKASTPVLSESKSSEVSEKSDIFKLNNIFSVDHLSAVDTDDSTKNHTVSQRQSQDDRKSVPVAPLTAGDDSGNETSEVSELVSEVVSSELRDESVSEGDNAPEIADNVEHVDDQSTDTDVETEYSEDSFLSDHADRSTASSSSGKSNPRQCIGELINGDRMGQEEQIASPPPQNATNASQRLGSEEAPRYSLKPDKTIRCLNKKTQMTTRGSPSKKEKVEGGCKGYRSQGVQTVADQSIQVDFKTQTGDSPKLQAPPYIYTYTELPDPVSLGTLMVSPDVLQKVTGGPILETVINNLMAQQYSCLRSLLAHNKTTFSQLRDAIRPNYNYVTYENVSRKIHRKNPK